MDRRATAGYSGTPLAAKLGIRGGSRVGLVGAPDGLEEALAPLPAGVRIGHRLGRGLDLVVVFVTSRSELERRWPRLTGALVPSGMLWVAWPKRSSGVATDMTEHVVRAVALPSGWVDTKVAAIDAVWSGLRLVLRLANRPAPGRKAAPE